MRVDRLDLNLIVALEAILRLRSVSRAAEELNLTQSALSRSLARLRAHFGEEIVVQSGRILAPTEFGASLLPLAEELLYQARAFSQLRVDFNPASAQREFSVICSDYVIQVFVTRVARQLSIEAPGVTLRCVPIDRSADEAFVRGKIDFRMVPNVALRDNHPHMPLFVDRFVCIAWAGNRDIGERLTRGEFLKARHVATAFGADALDSHLESYLKSAGIALDIAMRLPSFALLPQCIIETPYIATIHEKLAVTLPPSLPIRFLPDPLGVPVLTENLQWHRMRDKDSASRWMRELMQRVASMLEQPAREV